MRPALAKGGVGIGRPVDHGIMRPVEHALVAASRYEPQNDLVTLAYGLTAKLGIAGGGTAEMHGRRGEANELVRRGLPALIGGKLVQQRRIAGQAIQAHRDRIAGRVVAGSNQKAEEILEIGGAHPGLGAAKHPRKHALAAYLCLAGHDLVRIIIEVGAGGAAERHEAIGVAVDLVDHEIGEIGVGIADQRVTLLHEPVEILARQAEDLSQHQHRQLLGDGLDTVDLGMRQRLVQNLTRHLADERLIFQHRRARKGRIHHLAGDAVFRRISLLKGASRQIFLVGLVLDPDPLRRAEDIRRAVGGEDIGVARYRPEAAHAVGRFGPGHRILAAKPLECLVRNTVGIAVMVTDIEEPVINHGRPPPA